MTNDDTIDSASGALGFAMASFAISVNTLVVLSNQGTISSKDALEVMRRASAVLHSNGFIVQDADAAQIATEGVDLAKHMFEAATAQKPPSGSH